NFFSAGEKAWSTSKAKTHLKDYTGGDYKDMNYALRNRSFDSPAGKKAVKAANAIMKNGITLPEGIKLTRRYDSSTDIESIKPGSVVVDKGILSTSISSSVWSGNVKWNITLGPGVKGIPARNFSNHPSEEEVLLPPNQRLLVTNV